MASAELRGKLDEMARKGLVFRVVKGDTVGYRLNELHFNTHRASFWSERDDERNTTMAPWSNKYYYDLWKQFDYTHIKGLRTIPINATIEDTRQILPYEDVTKLLDNVDYFAVSICACRHRKPVQLALDHFLADPEVDQFYERILTDTIEILKADPSKLVQGYCE